MEEIMECHVNELTELLRTIDCQSPTEEFLSLEEFKRRLWAANDRTRTTAVKELIKWLIQRAKLPGSAKGRSSAVDWLREESLRPEVDFDYLMDNLHGGSLHFTAGEQKAFALLTFLGAAAFLGGAFAFSQLADWSGNVPFAYIAVMAILVLCVGAFVLRGLMELLFLFAWPGPNRKCLRSPASKPTNATKVATANDKDFVKGVMSTETSHGSQQDAIARRESLLSETIAYLDRAENDFSWSAWADSAAAILEVKQKLSAGALSTKEGRVSARVLFLPTGPVQEVAISSGWGQEFLNLANRADRVLSD